MANFRTIGVRLRLAVDGFRRDSKQAGDDADKMADRIERAGKKSAKGLDDFIDKESAKLGIFGAALIAGAGAAVLAFAKFDKQMSEVGAVSNASAEDLEKLSAAALKAGADTSFSASQAAEAEAELAKAGIKTADILSGGLTGALDLAAAGTLELGTAAEIAAAAMNTFHLSGKDVGHIADVLAAGANKSSAGVEDLGQGLQQVGLIAAQVNLTFDETVALLAAFADRGLKGSDGATSLKTALLRLAAPTGEAKDLMEKLNISMYDAHGQLIGAADVAGQLQDALDDLSPAQRNAALNTIFGSDAIRAANILYSQGRDGIQEYIDAVNDQGAASRVAAAKLDNLAGDVEQLKGSLETLFITAGSGSNDALRFFTQSLTSITNLVGALPKPVLTAATAIAALTGATLLGAVAVVKMRKVMLELQTSSVAAGVAVRGATAAMSGMTRVLGPATLAVIGFVGAVKVLDELDWLDWARGTPILKDIIRQVDGTTTKMHSVKNAVTDAAAAEQVLNDNLQDQIAKGSTLIEIWDILNGNMANADQQALEAVTAIEALGETYKENKGVLQGNSKAALENRVALEKAAKEAAEAAQAYADQTGDIEGARKKMKEYEDQAIKATGATGKQKDEVKKLADQLFRLPESKTFTLDVRGTGQLQRVISQLDRIEQTQGATSRRWGGITQHAESGLLRDAAVFSGGLTRYAFAEPGTGGEAFVPRNGNPSRSMAILNQAAGWYGASVVPGGGYYGGGGGATPTPVSVTVNLRSPSGQVLQTELVNFAVQTNRTPAQLFPDRRGR